MRRSTSQYGTFRTCEGNPTMSAIGGKPDITVSRASGSRNDPSETSAVRCGIRLDADFCLYESTRQNR